MGIGFPKPATRATVKRRRQRVERRVKQSIRAQCVERDGYCRLGCDCTGPSEWAHYGGFKRARTLGQAPERRHTTEGSLMLCRRHHTQYDRGELIIEAHSDRGCDGYLTFLWRDRQ
jgi:hypothetical protein